MCVCACLREAPRAQPPATHVTPNHRFLLYLGSVRERVERAAEPRSHHVDERALPLDVPAVAQPVEQQRVRVGEERSRQRELDR